MRLLDTSQTDAVLCRKQRLVPACLIISLAVHQALLFNQNRLKWINCRSPRFSAEFLRQALELKRQLNDTNGSAKVLHNLANVVRHQVEFIEAGSVSPVIYCLPAAALHAVDVGNIERAIELYSMAQRFDLADTLV